MRGPCSPLVWCVGFRLRSGSLALAAIVCFASGSCSPTRSNSSVPFPDVADIRAMHVTLDQVASKATWIAIPSDQWQSWIDAFLPAELDPQPIPWELTGQMKIQTETETVVATFSAQTPVLFRIKDKYYRSLNDQLTNLLAPSNL